MQGHADKAREGRIAEILADLTPEALAQLGPLMAGAPNPLKTNSVVPVSTAGSDHVFDVTYGSDGGATVSMRETVREISGVWKIINLERPS